ncbi:MAG: leucine-rich repeat protein, partial [Oscillospiraceae bacterium]|nr:leucine-rich repeat protein [Oscillospiraceae bacterium]
MQKHFKRLVSLLIVVFVISSVPIITSASSTVDSGSVNNSYQTRDLGKVNYSYTWEYHDDNTLVILPSSYNLYFNVNDLTDYMKTRFNSNTKITIDCSLGDELRLFGKDCPASNFTFIGPDLYSVDFYDFKSLNSINIDIDFAPSELPEIFNRVQVEIHRCGITTADIFEGEGYFVSLHIYDCNQITSLTAPEFVSYLYVFRCVNLESIQTTGKMSCFYVLLSENVKSIKVYGDITAEVSISNLPNLETFEFMGHVNYIRLNDIYIPDFTIRNNIGKYYIHCDSLTNVTFEPGITKINYEMFKDCINLSNVSIPFTVTEIHERAFANCSSLTSIVIPSDIDFICDDAFDGCDSLTDVYFPGNVELWESIDVRSGEDSDQPSDKSIYEIFGNATLHFPDPEIEKQPEDYAGPSGSAAEFTVKAEGSLLKYQWQVLKNGTWTNCSINDGARTDTLSLEIKSSRDGSKYRCVITDKFGKSLTTDEVTLTMVNPLIITEEPTDFSGSTGETATFSVAAHGDGIKYQWQVLKNGTWANCSINDGARTNTLSL